MLGSMWIRLLPYLVAVMLVGWLVWQWNGMVATIERQEAVIAGKVLEIETLKANAVEERKRAEDAKVQAVNEAIGRERKKNIEKELKRDESNKVDIGSTRYYILQ